ncbi:hypothetical protein J6590_004904 [Homalodisca vitripennis]|nr:hypothetical protein J6590_004904 [Homalodisca vitripennis]
MYPISFVSTLARTHRLESELSADKLDTSLYMRENFLETVGRQCFRRQVCKCGRDSTMVQQNHQVCRPTFHHVPHCLDDNSKITTECNDIGRLFK